MKYFILSLFLISSLFIFSQKKQHDSSVLQDIKKADYLYNMSKYDSAYYFTKKAYYLINKNSLPEVSDSLTTAISLKMITLTDSIEEKNKIFKNLIIKATKNKDKNLLLHTYYVLAKNEYIKQEFGNAQPIYLQVDSIAKKYTIENEIVIKSILDRSEISRTTFTYDGVELAHKLQLEALKKAKKIHSEKLIYTIYLRLADMNGLKGNMKKVKEYNDLAYNYYLKNENVKKLTRIYLNYLNYYYEKKDYLNAEKILQKGITNLKTKNNPSELARLLIAYGNFYRKKKHDCKNAIKQFKEAENIYKNINNKLSYGYMYLMEGMAICSAEIGDYKNAYQYYQKTYVTKKNLVKKANNDLSRKLETKYQAKKKEEEIVFLKTKKELTKQQKRNEIHLFIVGITLSTLAGLFFFFQFRNRQKTNKKLKELDKAKSNFYANISHEFRTPLTLISGPIQNQLNKKNLQENDRNDLKMVQRNTIRLNNLVNQLLDISIIESGNLKLSVFNENLMQFMSVLTNNFEFLAKQKQINYIVNKNEVNFETWFDKDIVEKIVTNILSNALKYTPEKGTITCHTFIKNKQFHFEVKNTGNGILKEERTKIFNKFYQLDENRQGVGIGLALVKELVIFHKGKIRVDSIPNKWTIFEVILPINKSVFNETEIQKKQSSNIQNKLEDSSVVGSNNSEEKTINDPENPIILIVDDYTDIRNYVCNIFKNNYTILQAKNGKEGIEMAIKHIPDIIISDIMMPIINGIELCNTLKTDERTCHIPIIILTAKAGEENEIKGIKTGADSYIIKPFNNKLLVLKVEKLLENIKILQKRFSQEIILKPIDVAVNAADAFFLERIQKVIDHNIIESSFSVENFCKAVAMSRMQLHRKLKAVFGMTASEFIRFQRLKLAAHLLQKSDVNISQIGYTVGFNDPAYFGKCFKKIYHCTPKEFANKKT